MSDSNRHEKRAEKRRQGQHEIVFHTKNDIYLASSVDISDRGIRIVTENPIDIHFQINKDNQIVQYDAQLIWARMNDDGAMEYGLKYKE